jgi:hypothetical protein
MIAMNTIGTRKERMRRALGRQPIDRLPVQTNFTRAMGRKLREALGIDASQLSRRLDNHLLRVDVGHTTRLSDDGKVGFGTPNTPGAVVRTEWKTNDIWLRREFTLPATLRKDPTLWMHYDESPDVYLNSVLAAQPNGYVSEYGEVAIDPAARATLRPGKNVLAVHCRQTTGGQYIDVGLVEQQP